MTCLKLHHRACWTVITAGWLSGCTVSQPPDGTTSIQPNEDGTVSTIAGTGAAGFAGDGGDASDAQLNLPMDLVLVDNDFLIADFNNHRVRSLDMQTGLITTIAGSGQTTGASSLDAPSGLATSSGTFLVADWGANHIYEFMFDGSLVRTIGNGMASCGILDGIDVLEASIVTPRSVGVMADGSILVSEQQCHRVRRIREDSVSPYAGSGESGYSGDDGPATLAALHAGELSNGPSLGISLSPEDPPDELFIADTANHVIRQVNVFTGQIVTVAGSGEPGYFDGPPEQARFNAPTHVFTGTDHSLWIVDTGNHAVRHIDPLGIRVTTVAGTGEAGFNGDGLAPTETQLDSPTSLWVTPDGWVFIADAGNQRIRLYKR